jgi:hypothetical protein
MDFSNLRPETRKLLESSGWFPGRLIDTTMFVIQLKAKRYPIHTVVIDFLAHFGKLKIVYPYTYSDLGSEDELCFDPIYAISFIQIQVVRAYGKRVKAPLCVIGTYNHLHDTLMMAPDGKVYGGYSEYLDLVGHSGGEAIDNILRGKDMWYERIP